MNKNKALKALIIVFLLLASALYTKLSSNGPTTDRTAATDGSLLSVHYIDVGQGDCTFIELPNNKTMLIDAGNYWNFDDISSYISFLGYSSINYIVATHPHSDHIGGMADIISSFGAETVYLPDVSHSSRAFEDMVDIIYEKNIKAKKAEAGTEILNENGLKIQILSPVSSEYSDLNEYSAVVKIDYGKNGFLFMGDAGHIAEREILTTGADVSADVIKCGHHGSSTSSLIDFVKKVSPDYAIISCGADNTYGHPHDEALALYDSVGAKIYRTDYDGTIVATSDGKSVKIE